MLHGQAQHAPGIPLIATDRFANFQLHEVNHHHPSRSDDVDVRRRMVVGVDREPQAADAQDRWHERTLAETIGQICADAPPSAKFVETSRLRTIYLPIQLVPSRQELGVDEGEHLLVERAAELHVEQGDRRRLPLRVHHRP